MLRAIRKKRGRVNDVQRECKITVIDKKWFPDLWEKYLAGPKSGPVLSSMWAMNVCRQLTEKADIMRRGFTKEKKTLTSRAL